MTVKELSEAFNVSAETVKRAIRECYPNKMQSRKTTYLNKEEALIVGSKIRKEGYVDLTQNESALTQNEPAVNQTDRMDRMDRIERALETVAIMMKTSFQMQEERIKNLESRFEERKALLPVPQMTDRQNLNKIIRNYSTRSNMPIQSVWHELYDNAYYRLNVNLTQRAKNEGMSIIQYAEKDGFLEDLLSLAIELFN